VASFLCIGALSGLSSQVSSDIKRFADNQATARLGNSLGILGVFAGMLTAVLAVGFTKEQLVQVGALTAIGGVAGLAIGRRVSPMALPQTVAALHSVVGLAAVMTSAAVVLQGDEHAMTTLGLTTAYLGVLIGGITFTGELKSGGIN
jgi:NAD(P) transhydrogenase